VTWERRYAFLVGLTGAAGALDALSFMFLGHVFTSFQSGNVLFLGLGIGRGDAGLTVRAGVVLVAFFAASAAGAHLVGRRLLPWATRIEHSALAIEAALLAAFAMLWIAVGTPADHHVARVALLALAAAAMGVQAALSLALKIPNVVTVALTATLAYLAQRAGTGGEEPRSDDLPTTGLLMALVATYATCAVVVATLPVSPAAALVPLAVLGTGVLADGRRRPVPA
jgi:uncharacterized membrane protein YoaK (UPF0700 family)